MFRLPLFPLGIVLFPHAPLPLHIFEPRYRRMVARCLEFDRRFGLIHHDPVRSGPFRIDGGEIGCVAEIERFKPLPDGRSLLLVRGVERFRIEDGIESGEPYVEALVELLPDRPGDPLGLLQRRLRTIGRFRALLAGIPDPPDPLPELEADPRVGWQVAALLGMDRGWEQGFLECRDEAERLDRLDAVLARILDSRAQRGGGTNEADRAVDGEAEP